MSSNQILESEFEHVPVPKDHRKSFISVASVWASFPMTLTSAVLGGLVTANLGFKMGVAAILTGNTLLCIVVGLLSYLAGSTGKSFAISAQRTFGNYGYIAVSALLATVVIGWFALMTGLTGTTMHETFGQSEVGMTILAGVLFIAGTFIGIRFLAFFGYIAGPLFVILGAIAIYYAIKTGTADIMAYQAVIEPSKAMPFGLCASIIFSTFIDSGTMTSDFTRWSKTGWQGFWASTTAFPFTKSIAELIGAIIVATGSSVITDPATNGGQFSNLLVNHNAFLTFIVVLFIFINLGVACTHCLYNGAVGWAMITKKKMRLLTIILGIIGVTAAASGMWGAYQGWLIMLGVLVPPIATIIIMDQVVLNRKIDDSKIKPMNFVLVAFVCWALASIVSLNISR
jgi:cytosine permease